MSTDGGVKEAWSRRHAEHGRFVSTVRLDTELVRTDVSAVSGYVVFLAVAAVVLFLFLVLVVVGGMVVAAVHLSKAYTRCQELELARHIYDTTELTRRVDGDPRWGPRAGPSVAQHFVPSDSNDNSFARAKTVQAAGSAVAPPAEKFRRQP